MHSEYKDYKGVLKKRMEVKIRKRGINDEIKTKKNTYIIK